MGDLRVVRLDVYRNLVMVAGLRDLMALAQNGDIHGLAFVAKFGRNDHRAGALGDYLRSPEQAMAAAFTLERDLIRDRRSG